MTIQQEGILWLDNAILQLHQVFFTNLKNHYTLLYFNISCTGLLHMYLFTTGNYNLYLN